MKKKEELNSDQFQYVAIAFEFMEFLNHIYKTKYLNSLHVKLLTFSTLFSSTLVNPIIL